MRFRWDWLRPVIRAPYVPTLGPVPPEAITAELFEAVLDVAHTGRFLRYDKDRRWSVTKNEHVLTDAIIHTAEQTIVPTLSTRGGGLIKLHHYAHDTPDIAAMTRLGESLAATQGAAAGYRTVWFPPGPEQARTQIMLKTFTDADAQPVNQIQLLDQCGVADTFAAFAAEIGPEGFQFLHQRMKAGHDDGPTLVAVQDHRIVGALGPLSLMPSPDGRCMQPPAYFAVHPAYRGRGHGRRLWRASMAWAHHHGADLKILQAALGSAAATLYATEGLQALGYVT